MGALPDSRSLAQLTIPGTHDSGAQMSALFGIGQCQSLSIADQLASGVRFLDIRLKLNNDSLDVYHGALPQNLSFDAVRSACKTFLAAHPGEVILMSIKQEDDDNASFPAAVAAAIAQDPDLWYTANQLPTLGDARGKIVLIRRYGGASIGINCAENWADNTDFAMNNGVAVKVQDYYNISQKVNLPTKWSKITALAEYANSTAGQSTFCLNFTSGYVNSIDIKSVSGTINPQLQTYFEAADQGHYGTYAIDFVTPELASALIAVNFPS